MHIERRELRSLALTRILMALAFIYRLNDTLFRHLNRFWVNLQSLIERIADGPKYISYQALQFS